uniref:C2H2-type domain-containing protein n=1 Tax=Strongyloides venezuelensis TaxID=75913 RepID=A0A0K0FER5_STRVS
MLPIIILQMELHSESHFENASRLKSFNNTIVFNKELHYDCNNKSVEHFNFYFPKVCTDCAKYSWHMEIKNVYKYHMHNKTCTKSRHILFVSEDFVIITVIEKRNNISYKLTRVIAENNASPNFCCIKENGTIYWQLFYKCSKNQLLAI